MKVHCPARALALLLLAVPVGAQTVSVDAWSSPIRWRTPDGMYAVGVHASLLPDGRVFFIGYARDTEDPAAATVTRRAAFVLTPTPAFFPAPADHVVGELNEPLDIADVVVGTTYVSDDLFCTGNGLTADGAVFTAGGTRAYLDLVTGEVTSHGLAYATRFDGITWTRIPQDMVVPTIVGAPARWYSAVTRLWDGRMMVTGGYDQVAPLGHPNLSVEAYDPTQGTWEVVSPYGAAPPEIFNADYTHPFVLPLPVAEFDVLMFGEAGAPVFLSLEGPQRWGVSSRLRTQTQPGQLPLRGATSVLLPIRARREQWGYPAGSVLVAGGDHGTSHESSADVYDPFNDRWLPRIPLGLPRHHPTAVLLPDGRVAVIAGHHPEGHPDLGRVSYIDPAQGFLPSLGAASAAEVRGYHHVAVLLPDGRVLVGGGQDLETGDVEEKATFRYLYPSYMFEERPLLVAAPEEIRYGRRFLVLATGKRPAEVVLVGLGSMTHSIDFNQRHVQLAASRIDLPIPGRQGHLLVHAPADPRVAPPGDYMLFVVDANRVPSEARIVRLR